jgi:hypothetical protein
MLALVKKSESKCWNYHKCNIKKVNANCINVKNEWKKIKKNNLLIYLLTNSKFIKEPICTY